MAGKVGIPRLCSTSAALADAYRSGQLSSKRCSSSSGARPAGQGAGASARREGDVEVLPGAPGALTRPG